MLQFGRILKILTVQEIITGIPDEWGFRLMLLHRVQNAFMQGNITRLLIQIYTMMRKHSNWRKVISLEQHPRLFLRPDAAWWEGPL